MAAPTTPGIFTSPTLGQVVDESVTVSWGASTDADGDPIVYRLYRDDINETGTITITDHGDGTWTATPNPTELITLDSVEQYFETQKADALYLDEDTYVVTTTSPTGVLIGSTASTSMVVDTSLWPDDPSVRFRVEAYAGGEFSASRYSEYFEVYHPKLVLVGATPIDAAYVGGQQVDAIFIGNTQIW